MRAPGYLLLAISELGNWIGWRMAVVRGVRL
jgi:hypothetical protein